MQNKIKGTELVEKSNILNEIRCNEMTLQELRFFSIYLAKINARDLSTRIVRFPLSDFQKIMDFGRLNIKQLQDATNRLLCKVVNVPNERGGYTGFVLFNEVTIDKDESNEWYVEINAHDKALPLMFELKGKYFKYKLWNVLKLKSVTQLRMYEILKQHEREKKIEMKMSEIRGLLGITPNQYPQLERFRIRVLDSCQKALAENTDICFTYERGKIGPHGKWLTIIFNVHKNKYYKDPIALEKFIDIKIDGDIFCNKKHEPSLEQISKEQPLSVSFYDDSEIPQIPDYDQLHSSLQSEPLKTPLYSGFHSFETDFTSEQIQCLSLILETKLGFSTPERIDQLLHGLYAKCKETCPNARKPFAYLLKTVENLPVEESAKPKQKDEDND
ncbi:MAG: replication initiation protein, partial [Ruminococcus sp.]|nr:replication initiation protein [Ruminococcus sp.]